MEQKQPNSSVHTEEIPETASFFEQFMITFQSLKELDLTDIEPILPPTYKEGRYLRK